MNYHNNEQMELMGHISFSPIQGHSHLYVADVCEDDEIMLKLLGIFRDPTISTEITELVGSPSRYLYKSGDQYVIVEIAQASIPKDK